MECIDWMKYKQRNKDQLVSQLKKSPAIEEEHLNQLSQNFDQALRDGIGHFLQIELDEVFFTKLSDSLGEQNRELSKRWNYQRTFYEVQ
jgi:hypothetical protein